jgi:large subunit ribosomal protein L15
MKLSALKPAEGSVRGTKRIGRGQGSGFGGTSTKGHKGQKAVSGYNYNPGFEGGQMPFQRRVPKFGFKNINRIEYNVVNLDTLQELSTTYNLTEITHESLILHGLLANSRKLVKVLGRGELKAKLNVKLNKFSASAKQAIEAAGGTTSEV